MQTNNKEQNQKNQVTIYMEANPNPNSMKFVANFMLVPEGDNFDFPDAAAAEHAPLAQQLFQLDYVKRVFYMSNFVTVTKEEGKEWGEIRDELKTVIKDYLETGKPVLDKIPDLQSASASNADTDIERTIKSVLDEYVRPAVEQDGGAISFHSFQDGVVKVLLQGACSGCPSSTITLKAGIENLLKRMVPEVKTVEAEGI